MTRRLIESLATTEPLAEVFSDHAFLHAMLIFETALARAQAHHNIIPQSAAAAISEAAHPGDFDVAAIIGQTQLSATPVVPLVKTLTERVRNINPTAAGFVHWGATSQDVCDTALVLLLQRAQPILEHDLLRLESALHRLAEQHAGTVMLGRTLLQAAGPVTFGLKAAGWFAAVHRGRKRLNAGFKETLVVQFGGATGTLAALGKNGVAIGQKLAQELGLDYPEAPWHTHRDRLAALLCACGILSGSMAKIARDASLLMQTEVGEASEQIAKDRGGSSTMPHKSNPVGCVAALASADRIPALVSSFLSCMVQEHERAAGGWQAEWPIIAGVIQATGLVAAAMAEVIETLTVHQDRMRANVEAMRGVVFAERAMMLLAPKIGRDAAQKMVAEAVRRSLDPKRQLSQVLSEMPGVKEHLGQETLRTLEVPEQYLGVAEEFRKRLLSSAGENPAGPNRNRGKE